MPEPATVVAVVSTAVSLIDKFTAKSDGGLSAMLNTILDYQRMSFDLLINVSHQLNFVLERLEDLKEEFKLELDIHAAKERYRAIIGAAGQFEVKMEALSKPLPAKEKKKHIADLENQYLHVSRVASEAMTFPHFEVALVYPLCLSLHIALLYKTGRSSEVPIMMRKYIEWADRIAISDDPQSPSLRGKAKELAKEIYKIVWPFREGDNQYRAYWGTRATEWAYEYYWLRRVCDGDGCDREEVQEKGIYESPIAIETHAVIDSTQTTLVPGTTADDALYVRHLNFKGVIEEAEIDTDQMQEHHYVVMPHIGRSNLGERSPHLDHEIGNDINWAALIRAHPDYQKELEEQKNQLLANVEKLNKQYIQAAIYARTIKNVLTAKNSVQMQLAILGG